MSDTSSATSTPELGDAALLAQLVRCPDDLVEHPPDVVRRELLELPPPL